MTNEPSNYEYVDFFEVEVGDRLRVGEILIEVTENLMDGIWVRGRFLEVPNDPSLENTEDQIFRLDVTSRA
jgi:hypothetical protein